MMRKSVETAWGIVPAADVVLKVTVNDEIIASIDIYWHTITVGDEPLEVAWLDHLLVDENFRNMGFGSALFQAAALVAGREREWGVAPSPTGYFKRFGWFEVGPTNSLMAGALSGAPQIWPSGEIEAVLPT